MDIQKKEEKKKIKCSKYKHERTQTNYTIIIELMNIFERNNKRNKEKKTNTKHKQHTHKYKSMRMMKMKM